MKTEMPVTRDLNADLRPATDEDVDAIVDIWHTGWRDAHLGHVPAALQGGRTVHDLRTRVPVRLPTTTVAVVGARVVGFVVTHRDEVEQLYVHADHRGTDVATALLDRGERDIARRSPRAWLAVVAGNARARRFYERRSWRDAGPFDYHAWSPEGTTFAVPCRLYEKQVARSECLAPRHDGS